MAKNTGSAYGRLDPDQRKRFERTGPANIQEGVEELDFPDDPRNEDHMGRHAQPKSEERRIEQETEAAESGPESVEPVPEESEPE